MIIFGFLPENSEDEAVAVCSSVPYQWVDGGQTGRAVLIWRGFGRGSMTA